MYLTKTIRNLGLDPAHQGTMVQFLWALNLSITQKWNIFNQILSETEQKILPIIESQIQARNKQPQPQSTTILGPEFSPAWSGTPPGMSKRDLEIWQRYKKRDKAKIQRIYYNVRVGTGTRPHHQATPEESLQWILCTMLRIDAIIERTTEILIAEVRPDAGRSAFGAAIMYRHFWHQDQKIEKPARAILITDNITSQVCNCCIVHNVAYHVV